MSIKYLGNKINNMFYNEIHYDQSNIYNYLSVNHATRRKADTKRG